MSRPSNEMNKHGQQAIEENLCNIQADFLYQQESIEAIEKTIAEQHLEIQLLKKQIKILSEHIKSLKDDSVRDIRDESPPPHY